MSKIRSMLWPIYGKENKKFIPMLIMMILSLFVYTSVRINKDALIITAAGSGAGVLNFLKGYAVMPSSILFVIYYSLMSNKVSKKNLFYVTLLPFIAFFVLFAVVLYPLQGTLHVGPDKLALLQDTYPRLRYVLPIFGYWSFSLFYVFAELWGNVAITLLFWQFANLTTTKDEVKRFYPTFATYGNFGLMAAGFIQRQSIPTEITCFIVIFAVITLAGTYLWVNKYGLEEVILKQLENAQEIKKEKKPTLKESFLLIIQSKYLRYIAIMVLAYGMTANLAEVTWKHQVKELYPVKEDYQAFMGNFFIVTGISTWVMGVFGKLIVGRFGWLMTALLTPIALLSTTCLFFGFTLYSTVLLPAALLVGSMPLILGVIIGAIQNIASKGTKYAWFDPATQMTYIPLEDELRIKGKAAVDVLGSRLGKSLGGHIQAFALILTGGSQITIAPFLMCISLAIGAWWIYATRKLSGEYAKKLKESESKGK